MRKSVLDFAAWAQRVSAFLRCLTRLPGAIDIEDTIYPPATDRYELDWLESDECGLPYEIRRFLSTASLRCAFSYQWKPPTGYLIAGSEVLPDRNLLQGGADLCEAAKYRNYANRDWFRDNLDPLYDSFGLKESSKPSHIFGAMAEEQSRGRVPILEIEGGEGVISLDRQATDGEWAVVYVEKAGDLNSRLFSPSFEQFLLDWEMTRYTRLSKDNLIPWIDPTTGQFCPDPEKSRVLNQLLRGNDFTLPSNRYD
jgi:hypothetical protein